MKYLIVILLLLITIFGYSQYNPALHNTSNKAYGSAQAFGTDARSMYYDQINFVYRAYVDTTEVWNYLNQTKYRTGQFPIVVNTGGTLNNGIITGGTNRLWYYKDGTNRNNLVPLIPILSINGQTSGNIIVKNADSIKGRQVDTSINRNNYVLTYDSINHKWYLSNPTGNVYTPGTGISITSNVISAQVNFALWNASKLQGISISTTVPNTGQILGFNGTNWVPINQTNVDSSIYATINYVDTGKARLQAEIDAIGPPVGGRNGVSKSGTDIVFGQNVGDITNPALLTADREIPTGGNNIFVTGTGTFNTAGLDNYVTNINGSFTNLSKITKGYSDSAYIRNDTTITQFGGFKLGTGSKIENDTVYSKKIGVGNLNYLNLAGNSVIKTFLKSATNAYFLNDTLNPTNPFKSALYSSVFGGFSTTPPSTVAFNGAQFNSTVLASNTQNLPTAGSAHPTFVGVNSFVSSLNGASGSVAKAAPFFGTFQNASASLNFEEVNLIDITYDHNNSTTINHANGIRLADLDVGNNNVGIYFVNGDSKSSPTGRWLLYDSIKYQSYISRLIADTITTRGLDNYATDISASFTSLSKVTKAYVDNLNPILPQMQIGFGNSLSKIIGSLKFTYDSLLNVLDVSSAEDDTAYISLNGKNRGFKIIADDYNRDFYFEEVVNGDRFFNYSATSKNITFPSALGVTLSNVANGVLNGNASAFGNLVISSTSSVAKGTIIIGTSIYDENKNNFGIGISPTSRLTLPAGTATINTAPLKFTSGTLLSGPEAGAMEFLTDKAYLTITTGTARKEITLNDGTLSVQQIPYTTTNGRLKGSSLFTFDEGSSILHIGTSGVADINIGVGLVSPTARLHLAAGASSPNTAAMKFTTGPLLSIPESGAIEWDGTNLFITQVTGPTRKQIAYTTDIPATSTLQDVTTAGNATTNKVAIGKSTAPISTLEVSNNVSLPQLTLTDANNNAHFNILADATAGNVSFTTDFALPYIFDNPVTAGSLISNDVTSAMIVGGNANNSSLTLQSTSSFSSTTGADIIFNSGNAIRMKMLQNGNFGINNTNPIYKLDVSGKGRFTDSLYTDIIYTLFTRTNSNAGINGIVTQPTLNNTSTTGGTLGGIASQPTLAATNTQNLTNLFGANLTPTITSGATGTITRAVGLQSLTSNSAAGVTITDAFGARLGVSANSGTITNNRGAILFGLNLGTNNTGLHLTTGNQNTANPSGNYGIYDATGYQSYYAGNVGIGVTSPTAYLHIKAGTTSANTAPIKFNTGSIMATPELGAFEYDSSNAYLTARTSGLTARFTLAKTLINSATLDFPNTAAGTSSDLTISVNGAVTGDVVALGVPNSSITVNSCYTAWVSSANTVTVRYSNVELVTAHDPASGTFTVSVIKYN